jgi:hypothetical protein
MNIIDGLSSSSLYGKLTEERKNIIRKIADSIEPLFAKIFESFPDFTPHGIKHMFSVIKNLENLVDRLNITVDANESFTLLIAAILHDVGMNPTLFNDDPKDADEIQKRIVRERHHTRSAQFIEESPLLGNISSNLRSIAAKMAKGHRQVNLHASEYDDPPDFNHLRFLSALLRLADELEITEKRVQFLDIFKEKSDYLASLPEESRRHWESHLSITDWDISEKGELVEVYGKIETYEGHLGIELVKDNIHTTIEEIRNIPYEGEYVFPHACRFDLEFQNLTSENYRVDLDSDSTIGFLIENLYSNRFTPIRELVQNGIDACRIKPETKNKSSDSKVLVTVQGNKVCITDNGMGMDLHIIDNYLKVLGKSFYESPDFEYRQLEDGLLPRASGKFGIGIFSTFLLTNTFIVRTKYRRDDSPWYETRFSRSFCPTTICKEPPNTLDSGTQIEFEIDKYLDENLENQDFYFRIGVCLNKTFLRPPIDIVLQNESSKETIGTFLKDENIGTIDAPYVSFESDEFRVHALTEENIFVGISWNLSESEESEEFVPDSQHYQKVAICLEGTLLQTINVSYLWRIANLVEALEDKSITVGSIAILDYPEGLISPILNREQAKIQDKYSHTDRLKKAIPGIITSLHKRSKSRDCEGIFWRKICRFGEESIFESLDMGACVELLTLVNPYEQYTSKTQYHKISRNIPDKERQIFYSSILGKFFDDVGDIVIKTETGWIPTGSKYFVAKYAIPYLVRAGWQLVSDDLPEIDASLQREQEGDWFYVTMLLKSLPTADVKDFISWLLPSICFGTRVFHTWLRHEVIEENWTEIKEELLNMSNEYTEILITQVYFHHRERKGLEDETLETIKSLSAIDQARSYSLIHRYDDALDALQKYVEKHPKVFVISTQGDSDFVSLDEIEMDFKDLRKKRPKRFQKLVNRAASVSYHSGSSRLVVPDYWR